MQSDENVLNFLSMERQRLCLEINNSPPSKQSLSELKLAGLEALENLVVNRDRLIEKQPVYQNKQSIG